MLIHWLIIVSNPKYILETLTWLSTNIKPCIRTSIREHKLVSNYSKEQGRQIYLLELMVSVAEFIDPDFILQSWIYKIGY